MRGRWLLVLPLLSVEMGCPHAFGRGGTIDMAVRKDIQEYYSARPCHISAAKWLEICDNRNGHKVQPDCPKECRPSP